MGWVTQAKLYLDRARHNVTELLSDDDRSDSSESSTAIGLLSFASYGEDLWLSKVRIFPFPQLDEMIVLVSI